MAQTRNVERAVQETYAVAAHKKEATLCCPVAYDPRYLTVLPQEIIEKDYGCGDPSQYLRPGETVLDLGSGSGKICYIAAPGGNRLQHRPRSQMHRLSPQGRRGR